MLKVLPLIILLVVVKSLSAFDVIIDKRRFGVSVGGTHTAGVNIEYHFGNNSAVLNFGTLDLIDISGSGVLKRYSSFQVMKNRKHLNKKQKYYSLRNQRLMQVKNELWFSLFKSFPFILWKEILVFGYVLLREPYLLKAYGSFFRLLPRAIKKRRYIMKNKKITSQEIHKWLTG